MKSPFIYIVFSILFCLPVLRAFGQAETLRVQIIDQQGRPLAGEAISIQGSDYFVPDEEGVFFLEQQKLKMPVRAGFRSEKFEVQEIAYFEEEGRLQVKASRVYRQDDLIRISLVLEDGKAADKLKLNVRYKGQACQTDANGEIHFPDPVTYSPNAIQVNGYQVIKEAFDGSNHHLKLSLRPLPVAKVAVQDTLMLSYEADFERITREIERERVLYEEKNHEIRSEILKIRDNLISEADISPKQRLELKRYLGNMERALQQNSEAIRQSEERTKEAIAKLRLIILEKDSLHNIAQGKIILMEEEKAAVEQSYQQKISIYLSIIVVLSVIALLIYVFAIKLRRQKYWLAEVNKRLKNMQQELTGSLQELNMRKAQIEDHNTQLELFVYKASHDIKGPLRSIMGLTQIGLADVKDATAQEYFTHIHKSTRRLDNLLADLLLLTKAKQAEVDKQEINLPGMLDEIVQSFKNIPHFERLQFRVDIQEGISFRSDEKMLYSVIQNFVENSIKYCDPSKEEMFLDISICREEGQTIFSFHDNGQGIDEKYLPKIFDMFFKTDPNSEGSGLGLHIVKVTIEKLGGTIKVKSARGKGSVFTITFYD